MNRIEKLMRNLPDGLDAGIISAPENRRYYTGFASSAGTLFVTREKGYFLTDFRYIEKARQSVRDCEVVEITDLGQQLSALARRHGVRICGVEAYTASLQQAERYRQALENVHMDTGTAFQEQIRRQRMFKDAEEIQKIEQAQALTESTFSHILSVIRAGVTEREIALEMEFFMRRQGADGVSFDFIVVSGNNSSLPHGVPTGKAVEKGDFITMDFGALVDGYHSDMTRTIAVGCVDEEQRRVYDTVLRAQRAALSAIRAGMRCSEADRAAREVIDGAGFAGCFGHGLGHGVGVEIHEAPNLSPRSAEILEPGMVVTVEPGIYIENRYGVRIEDMVVVQKGGCRNLTASPKELIIL